jgi:hypothetical protein
MGCGEGGNGSPRPWGNPARPFPNSCSRALHPRLCPRTVGLPAGVGGPHPIRPPQLPPPVANSAVPEHSCPVTSLLYLLPASSIGAICSAQISCMPLPLLVLREPHIPAGEMSQPPSSPSPGSLFPHLCHWVPDACADVFGPRLQLVTSEERPSDYQNLSVKETQALRDPSAPKDHPLSDSEGLYFSFKMAAGGPGAGQPTRGSVDQSNSYPQDQDEGHRAQGVQPDCPHAPRHSDARACPYYGQAKTSELGVCQAEACTTRMSRPGQWAVEAWGLGSSRANGTLDQLRSIQ